MVNQASPSVGKTGCWHVQQLICHAVMTLMILDGAPLMAQSTESPSTPIAGNQEPATAVPAPVPKSASPDAPAPQPHGAHGTPAATAEWRAPDTPDELQGRDYYRLEEKTTCKLPGPESIHLKTWANRLTIEDGRLLIWGPICSDAPIVVPWSEAARDLRISADRQHLSYKGEILIHAATPPQLCEAGQWCPVPPAGP